MVQSLNTKVDLAIEATAFTGFADYGKIMIGDKGFEFYNSRDSHKYIQIPWEEVDYVIASVLLKGKWIPRYAIRTKKNGTYTFSSKEATKSFPGLWHMSLKVRDREWMCERRTAFFCKKPIC